MSKVDMVSGKRLTSLIAKIGKSAASIKHDINVACHSAALHVLEFGNTTPINDLCKVASDVTHNNSVNRWFAEYCTWVKWDTKAKAFILKPELRKQVMIDENTVDPVVIKNYTDKLIVAKAYYEFTPPPQFNGVSVIGLLKAIEKKVAKAEQEANYMAATDPEEAAAMLAKIDTKGLNEVKDLLKRMAA